MSNPTKNYIQRLYNSIEEPLFIRELEAYAKENHIPIMEKDGIQFLKQLIRIHRPKQILEVGTAIGYSAIQMSYAEPNAKITSIEKNQERYEEALKNIKKAGLNEKIDVILGDANDLVVDLSGIYDLVFIDAAKGQYKHYVESLISKVTQNGLIVVDNVLLKGYVTKENHEKKRLAKLGEKIDRFNEWLMKHPELETTILESGDGIAIALKR